MQAAEARVDEAVAQVVAGQEGELMLQQLAMALEVAMLADIEAQITAILNER